MNMTWPSDHYSPTLFFNVFNINKSSGTSSNGASLSDSVVNSGLSQALPGAVPDVYGLWNAGGLHRKSLGQPPCGDSPVFAALSLKLVPFRNIITDNAPKRIVVDTKVAVNKAVASRNDHPPWNFRMIETYIVGDVSSGFTNQLKIAQGGIVVQATFHKSNLIKSLRVAKTFSAKAIISSR